MGYQGEIILYQPDELVKMEVRLEDETVWLTQAQISELFQCERTVITKHINNVFNEKELNEKTNVHYLHVANSDKFNAQYPPIEVKVCKQSYDRFLTVDDTLYHIGASLKDLGKRWFAFSRMELSPSTILNSL